MYQEMCLFIYFYMSICLIKPFLKQVSNFCAFKINIPYDPIILFAALSLTMKILKQLKYSIIQLLSPIEIGGHRTLLFLKNLQ